METDAIRPGSPAFRGDAPATHGGVTGTRMSGGWNDGRPICRQLRDHVAALILEDVLKEGDSLPSVRAVAAEYRVNPLTVLKACQQLVDEDLVETSRGRGMFVKPGARDLLVNGERRRFLEEQWPPIHATIQRLGLSPERLLEAGGAGEESKPGEER
jgi:GntR family transcriptional regulator